MKGTKALIAALVAAAAIVAVFVVPAATADPGGTNNAYVCYSTVAAPELFSADNTSVFASWNSYAKGYFSPFVTTDPSLVTGAAMHGYNLICALPTGWIITGYVLGDGSKVVPDPKYGTVYLQNGLPLPGVYPVIGPPPATTG